MAIQYGDGSSSAGTASDLGRVVQVKTSYKTSTSSTTSDSLTGTGHSCSITPHHSSNKVIFIASAGTMNSSAEVGMGISMYRDGTNLDAQGNAMRVFWGEEDSNNIEGTTTIQGVVTTNTTSSTTFEVYFRKYQGGTARWGNRGAASLILIEVAGQ
tara:strand:+ start:50 stop:517 length:468 start_codon:yes stop_codon:yes gene_type:complete